jgi:hypothetical protein
MNCDPMRVRKSAVISCSIVILAIAGAAIAGGVDIEAQGRVSLRAMIGRIFFSQIFGKTIDVPVSLRPCSNNE